MFTCMHCNTQFDGSVCPACGVRRPVALIDQNPNIDRSPKAPATLPEHTETGWRDAFVDEAELEAAKNTPVEQPQTMLEAMFGEEAVESISYRPKAEDGLPLARLRAYFSTGGSATQAVRVLRHILKGDARAAAQCSLSAYGRKSWFFLLPAQAVVISLLALTATLKSLGTFPAMLERCSVVWLCGLAMLTPMMQLFSTIMGGQLRLCQTLSLIMTSTLPLILTLPFACLAARFLPQLLPASLMLCLFVMLSTLYSGEEFVAMCVGRRSVFLFALLLLPWLALISFIADWLIF